MTGITDVDSFLAAARARREPQRRPFVFVKTVLPADADAAETVRCEAGQGGGLLPVTSVDQHPDEVAGFEALRDESNRHADDWHILLAGALAGRDGRAPANEDVDRAFDSIIRNVHAGGDLPGLPAFDRDGDPLRFTGGTRAAPVGPVLTQINMGARRLANNAGSTARRCHAIMFPGPGDGAHRRRGTATAEGS